MSRVGLAMLTVLTAGCFDFRADLAKCQQEGRCPLEDGGSLPTDGSVVVPAGGLCAQGICWEHPFPVGSPVASLYARSDDELFVGASAGVIVRVEGGRAGIDYVGRPLPPDIDWARVSALAECSARVTASTSRRQFFQLGDAGYVGLAVGAGAVGEDVDQGWTSPERSCSFVGNNSQSIWMAEERDGGITALGSPSSNQVDWRRMAGLGGTSRSDLWLASTADVWARAADGGFELDSVPLPDGGLPGATGICSLGGGAVFTSTGAGLLARSTGWGAVGDVRAFSAVSCLGSGEVVAAGDGVVRRCVGAGGCTDVATAENWRVALPWRGGALLGSAKGELGWLGPGRDALERLSTGTRNDLADVSISPAGDAWAAGAGATLLHRVDGTWRAVDAGLAATDDLYAVAALPDGRVVAAGRGGVLRVLQPDGGVDKPRLYRVGGVLVQNQQLGQDFRRIAQVGEEVWAAGTRGVVMVESTDGTWHERSGTGIDDIYDVASNDAGVVWLTGNGAGIRELSPDGGSQLIRGPFQAYAFFVAFTDSRGVVWFAGRAGLATRLDTDGTQTPFTFPGNRSDDIIGFLEQPDALYAVGQASLYRHAGGTQWEILGPLPVDRTSNALQRLAPQGGDFFVVGKAGAILRVARDQWLQPP